MRFSVKYLYLIALQYISSKVQPLVLLQAVAQVASHPSIPITTSIQRRDKDSMASG